MATRVLKVLGVFIVWNLLLIPGLFLPAPALGIIGWVAAVWIVHRFALRSGRPGESRRRAIIRLRPLRGDSLRWTLVALPVLVVLMAALQRVYLGLVPVPLDSLDPFDSIARSALGRLSVALLAVGVAPLMEEFFFRGLIQHPLERRWGPAAGIAGAAAVFAAVHVLPWIFPLHLFLGLAFGWAVYATRSIWAGVLLHAGNNALAVFGLGTEEISAEPTIWTAGAGADWWISLAVLAGSAMAAAWVARRMWKAGRGREGDTAAFAAAPSGGG